MSEALRPGRIGSLRLRNRIIKTATFEGMTRGGTVSEALVEHHASLARRGVALTTVSYGAVLPGGRTFPDQLLVRPGVGLDRLAEAVRGAGGATSLQLVHCGGFSKNRAAGRPLGPSFVLNPYGLAAGIPFVGAMGPGDLEAVVAAFAEAAAVAREAGIEAVELHCGHGYLLSQFLSPVFNRRKDAYGGDLAGRLRLPLEVLAAIRDRVGPDYPVLAKTNLDDGVPGGSTLEDGVAIARALAAGGADAIVPSGGLVQRSAFYLMRGRTPLAGMAAAEEGWLQRQALRSFGALLVREFPYEPGFFFGGASAVLDAVDVPVGLLGGVDSAEVIDRAMARGFDFVVMGRALLADPDFVERLARGERPVSRCTHGNECVARMDSGLRCVLPDEPCGRGDRR